MMWRKKRKSDSWHDPAAIEAVRLSLEEEFGSFMRAEENSWRKVALGIALKLEAKGYKVAKL